MVNRRTVAMLVFYGGLSLLMALLLADVLRDLIPARIAGRIGYNSEGYTAALLLGLWIQFARPRLADSRWQWPGTIAVGVAFAVLGVVMVDSDWPSRVKTLNESMLGLALVIPYVQARRPVPARWAVAVAAVCFAAIVVFNHADTVTRYAEGFVLIVLVPLALDVVDRAILAPDQPTSPRRRYVFYALLVLLPITSSLLFHGDVFRTGLAAEWIRYEVRVHESFVAVLLVCLYFAVGLGRTGPAARADAAEDTRRTNASDTPSSVLGT